MMSKITNIVENGLIDVESSSQRVVDELKVSFEENMTKDQEINNFLTTMKEIASGDDLKDFFDQVLLNWVTSEEDEKEIVSMKDESFPFNQSQPIEILENAKQVILSVSNKPIESRAMVVVKSLFTSLEKKLKTNLFNISKDFWWFFSRKI